MRRGRSGCDITSFIGPVTIAIGGTTQLKVDIQNGLGATGSVTEHIMLRVPSGWAPTAATYSGTANGSPVAGVPSQAAVDPSADCSFVGFVGAAPAGFKDLWFSKSFAASIASDSGTLTVTVTLGVVRYRTA